MAWYLRSAADHDTHRGELDQNDVVVAVCGATFQPLRLPYGRIALPGNPYDRDQVCPECQPGGGD